MRRAPLLLAALCITTSAAAAATTAYRIDTALWEEAGQQVRLKTVAIGVPRAAGAVALDQLGALRAGGSDNVATYRSADGEIIGTIYLYKPGLADPTLAAIATGEVLAGFYGKPSSPVTLARVGTMPGTAYRAVFDDIVPQASQGFTPGLKTSVAAFASAGGWLIKLRVTGPAARRADVLSTTDALLEGISLGPKIDLLPLFPYEVTKCAGVAVGPPAMALPRTASVAEDALVGAVASRVVAMARDPDGVRRLCEMEGETGAGIRMFLSTNGGRSAAYALFGDAGNVVRMMTMPPATGAADRIFVTANGVGRADIFGPFDKAPTVAQLVGFTTGDTGWLGAPLASVTYEGDKSSVSVFAEPSKR